MSPQHKASEATASSVSALASELTACLTHGKLVLPSYPDVAIRIRKVLADENVTPERIGRVLSSEPALAAQLMRLANSVALNPGGRAVTELRAAVARLGFNMVRSATIAFAMSQVKNATELRGLKAELDALWHRSALVAALCFVSARALPTVNADEALLAGLLHSIGRFYLLTKAHHHPAVFADAVTYQRTAQQWHAVLATALLEQWEMPKSIVEAVKNQDQLDRQHSGPADLADVLLVATAVASLRDTPDELLSGLQHVPALSHMGLDGRHLLAMLDASQEQVNALQTALGL